MHRSRWFRLFLFLAVVYFAAALVSQVFERFGGTAEGERRLKLLRVAHLLCPCDYLTAREKGFALLETGHAAGDDARLADAVRWFERALGLNPLDAASHHQRAQALLLQRSPDDTRFAEAVASLKRAAAIMPRRLDLALDTVRLMLSMWPLLGDADQKLCWDLLAGVLPRLSWETFAEAAELWWLYSRNREFIETLVRRRPDFAGPLADRIIDWRGPLDLRWKLLAWHERFVLQEVRARLRGGGEEDLDLLHRIDTIHGYHRLVEESGFDVAEFEKLKADLLWERVKAALKPADGRPVVLNHGLEALLVQAVRDIAEIPRLEELKRRLRRAGLLVEGDFTALRLELLMNLREGDFNAVIERVEKLKGAITHIEAGARTEFVEVLLILTDAYEAANLLTVAEGTLVEALSLAPGHPGALVRLVRVRRALGDAGTLEDELAPLRRAHRFTADGSDQERVVYPVGGDPLLILLDPAAHPTLFDRRLLRVFVDGWIRHESFIGTAAETVTLPLDPALSRVRVSIRFL